MSLYRQCRARVRANDRRREESPGYVQPQSSQLDAISGHTRRRSATVRTHLTGEGHRFEPCCAHQKVFTLQWGLSSRLGLTLWLTGSAAPAGDHQPVHGAAVHTLPVQGQRRDDHVVLDPPEHRRAGAVAGARGRYRATVPPGAAFSPASLASPTSIGRWPAGMRDQAVRTCRSARLGGWLVERRRHPR